MKHKAKSFIAVLLALCLMMSLGVGALADGGSEGGNSVPTLPGDVNIPDGGPGDGGGSNPPEPRVGGEYTLAIHKQIKNGTVTVQGKEPNLDGNFTAKENESVTLIVTPKSADYVLEELTVFYGQDTSYTEIPLTEEPYTFTMPGEDVAVKAIFKVKDPSGGDSGDTDPGKYTITVQQPAEGGEVELDNTITTVTENTWVSFTAKPSAGYKLVNAKVTLEDDSKSISLSGNGTDAQPYKFQMPACNVTISAEFAEDEGDSGYSINKNVQPAEGGTVTVVSVADVTTVPPSFEVGDKTAAKAGSLVIFLVSANPGYELVGYPKVNDGAVTVTATAQNQYQFTMPASDVTISAVFQEKAVTPETHNITVDKNPPEGGTVTLDKQTAQAGDTVSFTVKPNEGYEIGTVVVAGASKLEHVSEAEGKYSFKMPASIATIYVNFKDEVKHNITVDDDIANGRVTASATRAAKGTPVTLTAVPDDGYVLDKYIVTMGGTPVLFSGDTFKMPDGDVNVSATFKLKQDQPDWSHWHKIDTWSNSVDGGISVGNDADMALAGSTVTFRVWHNYRYDYYDYDVYVLNDRTGNRVSLDYSAYYDRYSFTMPDDDVTIYVYFDYAGRYSITKDVEGDGSIYVRSSADHGDTVWIEAAPSAGQSLTSLRVFYGEPWAYGDKGYYGYWDEAEVKYSTYWDAYYFTMPADDVVVYARFTDGATVDVITGDHGDAKVSSRYADKGDWVYITAYPDEGYEVDSVTVTDSLGRSVKVTELSYDYFLFTMPGTNVDVKVTFRAKDYDVFYDVSRGDWYYKAVRFVHEKGIMEGTGTHYFSPEADLSRGMLATILYRLEGSPSVSGYSGFADVADTAYYAKAVAWAKANGIVNGVTATAYEPDTAVTREELAAILCRYAAFKGKDTAISYDYLAGFSDANTSHVYARPALNWAVAYDIINGQGNGVLAPRATATRAEVAQVLMNYLEVFD